jgi:putative oxidoreductase
MPKNNRVAVFLSRGVGRALLFAARLVLGGVFIYAGYSKIHFDGRWHFGDYQFLFALAIDSYKMMPLWLVQLMARFLPWLEVVLGVLLILGIGSRWVTSAMTVLLVVFMIALTRATILGLEINCGCFGYNSVKPSTELLHDSGLLLLALAVTAAAFLAPRTRRAVA